MKERHKPALHWIGVKLPMLSFGLAVIIFYSYTSPQSHAENVNDFETPRVHI